MNDMSKANGVEIMFEHWEARSEELRHSHTGDDMTMILYFIHQIY